ncbi:hypothetical protein F7P69_19540 [Cellulosimicrobium funkei]|nr:hypothetical protein [Cellulosimicrobium funkei]
MNTPSHHVPPHPTTAPDLTPSTARPHGWSDASKPRWMNRTTAPSARVADLYRATLWTMVAVLAIVIWFSAAPSSTAEDWSSDISSAEAGKVVNDGSTSGAPQQQVVNGWFVVDTIPILSEQLSEIQAAASTGRLPALALLFGLAACADLVGRSLLSFRGTPSQSAKGSEKDRTSSTQEVPTLGA